MATVAETWLERGRAEGEEKGRAEGRAEGEEKGRAEGREEGRMTTLKMLRHYLAMRFNLALDHFDRVLMTLDLHTLTQLSDAAFEAESLADFEAALQKLTAAGSDAAPVDRATS